jgi:hypothetical protein
MLLAIMTQSNIDAGQFGFYGFPLGSVVYAIIRMRQPRAESNLRERIAKLEAEVTALGNRPSMQ